MQHFTFVNMPLLTPTIPSSLPETCCFLRPKFTLLEMEGGGRGRERGKDGVKDRETESRFKSGQVGGEHPERIMPG